MHFSVKIHYKKSTEWGRIEQWNDNGSRGKMRKANGTIGELWRHIFGTPHPHYYNSLRANCFAVSSERILKHPQQFYKKMISFVNDHPNPEEGHYLERLWEAIFTTP